jgi:hypothetical protein
MGHLRNPPQMTLVHDDHMIQTFPQDTSHQSFDVTILPRGMIRSQLWPQAKI